MKCLQRTWCAAVLVVALAARAADDLAPLSDEFNYGPTITNWVRVHEVEGWGNNVLEQFDINVTRSGRLLMVPYSSSWYAEYRGELTFKYVTGDFVITTEVEPTRRTGTGAPQSEYSLAGIMIRTPRSMTNIAQWTPNGQNYVFLSIGAASNPGTYQFEVKTTVDSTSTLHISNGAPARAMIQVARLGPHIITLQRSLTGAWQVHRRYFRPDMPAQMQAGLTVYTDWPLCSAVGVQNQNTRVLTNGAPLSGGGVVAGANPDLMAAFDFVRYRRPQIPAHLVGADFSNPAAVTDVQLLSFLGTNANVAHTPPPQISRLLLSDRASTTGFPIRVQAAAGLSGTLQWTTNLTIWTTGPTFPGTGAEVELIDTGATNQPMRFYRVLVGP